MNKNLHLSFAMFTFKIITIFVIPNSYTNNCNLEKLIINFKTPYISTHMYFVHARSTINVSN